MRALYGTSTSQRDALNCESQLITRAAVFRFVGIVLFVSIGTAVLVAAAKSLGLMISETDSAAPAGVYRLTNTLFKRGDLVVACLPREIAREGLGRGYLQAGPCPGNAEPVAKIIGALPGDLLDVESSHTCVNGLCFDNSAVAQTDTIGRDLSHVGFGKRVVAPNQIWLFGFNDRKSWDSRYFGPLPIPNVRGKAQPILTW